jgi:hypothetical protein
MTASIKRSLVKTFLNTRTAWSLIGDGVVTGKIAYNPKVTEEQYITEDSTRVSVDSYAPKLPIEQTAKVGDAVWTYLDALRYSRSIEGDVETEIVNVWLYATPAAGYYAAERQSVAIQIDDFGSDGGVPVKINYIINFVGDPVAGSFNPSTGVFMVGTGASILTTLVLGSGTLAPLFATSPAWLWYTTNIAAATVTMASTLAGSTIVQKVGDTVVGQGGAAALVMGHNYLTITVTKSGETSVYHIDAIRTA